MDPNVIPTAGGAVLLVAVWASVLIGRAYVGRLRRAGDADAEQPRPGAPR